MSKAIVPAEKNGQLAKTQSYEQLMPKKQRCYLVVQPASELHRRPGKEQADLQLREMPDRSEHGIKECVRSIISDHIVRDQILIFSAITLGLPSAACAVLALLNYWHGTVINTTTLLGWFVGFVLFGLMYGLKHASLHRKYKCDRLKEQVMAGQVGEHEEIKAGMKDLRSLVNAPSTTPVELPLESVVLSLDSPSKAVRDYALNILDGLSQSMRIRICEYYWDTLSIRSQYELKGNDSISIRSERTRADSLTCIDWSQVYLGY